MLNRQTKLLSPDIISLAIYRGLNLVPSQFWSHMSSLVSNKSLSRVFASSVGLKTYQSSMWHVVAAAAEHFIGVDDIIPHIKTKNNPVHPLANSYLKLLLHLTLINYQPIPFLWERFTVYLNFLNVKAINLILSSAFN